MIIDLHAHVFEPHTAGRIMQDMAERAKVSACTDGTVTGLLASMAAADIDLSVISRITTRPEQVRAVNAWLGNLRSPKTHPLATAHPQQRDLGDEVARLADQGFTGFKLHPDYQGFFVDERRMFPFYEAVRAAGMWILMHAGLDRGLPGLEVHAPPRRMLRVLDAFPGLKIVAAHMGGEEIYAETEQYLLGRDIYLDTSFVLRRMPLEVLKRMVCKHSPERILFGTDSPWVHQGEDLTYLFSLDFLSDADKERIAGRNAEELLGLVPSAKRPVDAESMAPSEATRQPRAAPTSSSRPRLAVHS